jgi:hypothetical protein
VAARLMTERCKALPSPGGMQIDETWIVAFLHTTRSPFFLSLTSRTILKACQIHLPWRSPPSITRTGSYPSGGNCHINFLAGIPVKIFSAYLSSSSPLFGVKLNPCFDGLPGPAPRRPEYQTCRLEPLVKFKNVKRLRDYGDEKPYAIFDILDMEITRSLPSTVLLASCSAQRRTTPGTCRNYFPLIPSVNSG